jgi:hypothetical protein
LNIGGLMEEPIKLKDLAKLTLNLDSYNEGSESGKGTNYVVAKITIEKDLDGKYENAIIEPLDIFECDMTTHNSWICVKLFQR